MRSQRVSPLLAFALLPAFSTGTASNGAARSLTLDAAIDLALEKNEGILIERKSLAAAEAGSMGAKGPYDPLFVLAGGWRRATEPVNSAFSGAPADALAPTSEVSEEQRRLPTAPAHGWPHHPSRQRLPRYHRRLEVVASYDRFGLAGTTNSAAVLPAGIPVVSTGGREGRWGRAFSMLGEGHFDDARVGLEFEIPLPNRTARAAATTARNVEQQADAELARARKVVRAEVLDAAAALQSAGQRIEAARAGREAAEVQLSSERDRYDVGLSTNFLVLPRQNDLSQAQLAEITAQTDYRTAHTEMARATGALLEQRGIDVDTTP